MPTAKELLTDVEQLEKKLSYADVVTGGTPTPGTVVEGAIFWSEPTMLFIAIAVLIFGLVVFLLTAYLLYKNKSPDLLLKSFGIPLIIVSSIFLIVAGYTEKQITPVIGLLGTIAGYLLAKNSKEIEYVNICGISEKLESIEKEVQQIKNSDDKNIT